MTRHPMILLISAVVLSVLASVAATLVIDRQREPILPDVVRAKKVELIDAQGRIRAVFELAPIQGGETVTRLVMRDADGRDSISMSVDKLGFGSLGFSNNHWNEGAVQLGYLGTREDVSLGEERNARAARTIGAWGVAVRSPRGDYTGLGFRSNDQLLAPTLKSDPRTVPY